MFGVVDQGAGATRLFCDMWSGCSDLNRGPLRPERSALPSCATPRRIDLSIIAALHRVLAAIFLRLTFSSGLHWMTWSYGCNLALGVGRTFILGHPCQPCAPLRLAQCMPYPFPKDEGQDKLRAWSTTGQVFFTARPRIPCMLFWASQDAFCLASGRRTRRSLGSKYRSGA